MAKIKPPSADQSRRIAITLYLGMSMNSSDGVCVGSSYTWRNRVLANMGETDQPVLPDILSERRAVATGVNRGDHVVKFKDWCCDRCGGIGPTCVIALPERHSAFRKVSSTILTLAKIIATKGWCVADGAKLLGVGTTRHVANFASRTAKRYLNQRNDRDWTDGTVLIYLVVATCRVVARSRRRYPGVGLVCAKRHTFIDLLQCWLHQLHMLVHSRFAPVFSRNRLNHSR